MASPSTALSLIQRLSAKEWNVRLAANEELLVLFNEANESHVADFAKYVPYLKKIVVDPYPPVKEKAMDALLVFMSKFNYHSIVPSNFGGELSTILIDKCLSARDSIKTKTVEALLLLIESGFVDVVVSELCRIATTHKVPKISSLCVFTLREAVIQFGLGPSGIPPDHILPILEACFDHPFKDMRTEAFALTVEVHRWLGAALRPHIKGLRPTQQKELEAAFEMIPPDSRQGLVPPRVIKRANPLPSSSPIAVPSQALQSSSSNSSVNSSPSVQASLASLKSNPKRRSLSIPKASQFHSPVQTPTGSSPSTPTHLPSPSYGSPTYSSATPTHSTPSGFTPASQIPIRRSLTNIQIGSNNSTPVQSPTSTPSSANVNRNSISLTHEDIASALENQDSSDYHSGIVDGEEGIEDQNLPPVDLLSNLNSDWYRTLTDSGGTWHARKAQVDQLISLVPHGSPLKGNTNEYSKLVTSLTRLFADPNISVQQSALRAIETLALGLRADFSLHAKRLAPFLLEKFKDKKAVLVESVHSLLDLFHQLQCFTIADHIDVITTLSSKNPQMRYECLLWLERVIPTTSRQALLQVAAPLCDSLVKLLDDSVVAVRNAASRAFVWLGETLGEQAIKPFMDNLSRQHLLKIKEVKEITFFKKETPSRPATGNVESTNSSSRPNTASSESAVPSPLSSSYGTPSRPSTGEPVRPSTGDIARPPTSSSKPVPRPGVVRQHSSKSLLPVPANRATPVRQPSTDYFDGDFQASVSDEDVPNEVKFDEEANSSRNSLTAESPFNESNSIYQVLHNMKLEVSSFYAKVNANMETFEKRLKEKDGKRQEEAQFIQEYDKELHLWNEELQVKNKTLTEELQQAREAQAMLTTQLDDYENRITDLRQQTTEYKEKITEFQTLQASTSSSADADAQEKFALLDELEGLTMEKEEALSRLEDEKREKEDERREREMAALERDEAIRRLAEERRERGLARARLEDIDHLSSLEDEELDRLEEEHRNILEAIAKAKASKQS